MSISNNHRDFVSSMARGISVLLAFGRGAKELTITEVAKRTGLNPAAARRLLLTLTRLGYIKLDRKRFRLTPKVLDLGFAYLSSTSLWETVQPFLEQVTEEAHESCTAAVLDGTDVVYVIRAPTRRIMATLLSTGTRLPAYPSALGRVLLSALAPADLDAYFSQVTIEELTPNTVTDEAELRKIIAEAGRQGYAIAEQELLMTLSSIAVPVRSKAGDVLAAMNVSGHASRLTTKDLLERVLPRLLEAADGIREALPTWP